MPEMQGEFDRKTPKLISAVSLIVAYKPQILVSGSIRRGEDVREKKKP